jgi:Protein of unknown function (DUF3592)
MRLCVLRLLLDRINREVCFGGMFGLALVAFTTLFFAFPSLRNVIPNRSQGERTKGTVVGKREERKAGGHKGRIFRIEYEFVDSAGNQHRSEDRATSDDWIVTRPGDQIEVRHLRGMPGQSRLENTVREDFQSLRSPIAIGFGAFLGAIIFGVVGILRVRESVLM